MTIHGKNLQKAYKGRKVVQGVTFDISQGEIVGLLGPNGAGKTTTFYMTTGLVRPNDGKVFFDDLDVTHWPMYKRARGGDRVLASGSQRFSQADGRGQPQARPGVGQED